LILHRIYELLLDFFARAKVFNFLNRQ